MPNFDDPNVLFMADLNSDLWGVNSWAFFLNINLYRPIMLDSTGHAAKNPYAQYVCREGPSKMWL